MTSDDDASLDPRSVETPEDLGRLMKRLYMRAGHSYKTLEKWAEENGESMPGSTLSNVIKGKYPPSGELLNALLRACQVPDRDKEVWQEARKRAVEWHRIPELRSGHPLGQSAGSSQ